MQQGRRRTMHKGRLHTISLDSSDDEGHHDAGASPRRSSGSEGHEPETAALLAQVVATERAGDSSDKSFEPRRDGDGGGGGSRQDAGAGPHGGGGSGTRRGGFDALEVSHTPEVRFPGHNWPAQFHRA